MLLTATLSYYYSRTICLVKALLLQLPYTIGVSAHFLIPFPHNAPFHHQRSNDRTTATLKTLNLLQGIWQRSAATQIESHRRLYNALAGPVLTVWLVKPRFHPREIATSAVPLSILCDRHNSHHS